jgi:hypothetical protein
MENKVKIIGTLDGPGSFRRAAHPCKVSLDIRETVEWIRTHYKPVQSAW